MKIHEGARTYCLSGSFVDSAPYFLYLPVEEIR